MARGKAWDFPQHQDHEQAIALLKVKIGMLEKQLADRDQQIKLLYAEITDKDVELEILDAHIVEDLDNE